MSQNNIGNNKNNKNSLGIKERVVFLKNAILNPKEVAYILPSGRALIKTIAKKAELDSAKHIVELGPGTGGTTIGILDEMPKDASLCAVEINKSFINYINKTITDPRLEVIHDGAQNLQSIITNQGWKSADVVISGIPFSTLPKSMAEEIINGIYGSLKPGGLFVAYQLRDKVGQLATPVFGEPTVYTEYKNFPPMRIFVWEKKT